jgi:NAD-dependent deacetylase
VSAPARTLPDYLRAANRILIFTGAGISTGSGIPDFRGPKGVWTQGGKPVYYQDFMTSETARIAHWHYKLGQWEQCSKAHPNATHRAIVQLEKAERLIAVLTQNVDGLHTLAGSSPERLVELHGTNTLVECQSCGKRCDPAPHFKSFRQSLRAPECVCGGYLKLATISFGQGLKPQDLERAGQAAEASDLVVALGSTLSVHPAASFPLLAAQRGVPYAIINRGATDHDQLPCVSLRLEGDVSSIFPAAVEAALAAR